MDLNKFAARAIAGMQKNKIDEYQLKRFTIIRPCDRPRNTHFAIYFGEWFWGWLACPSPLGDWELIGFNSAQKKLFQEEIDG